MSYISCRTFISSLGMNSYDPKKYKINTSSNGMVFLYIRIGESEVSLGFDGKADLMEFRTIIDSLLNEPQK